MHLQIIVLNIFLVYVQRFNFLRIAYVTTGVSAFYKLCFAFAFTSCSKIFTYLLYLLTYLLNVDVRVNVNVTCFSFAHFQVPYTRRLIFLLWNIHTRCFYVKHFVQHKHTVSRNCLYNGKKNGQRPKVQISVVRSNAEGWNWLVDRLSKV